MLLLPLCQVRMKDLDRIVEGMEKGKLLVLCCMADWNPLCRKVISVLEAVNSRPDLAVLPSSFSVGSAHPLIEWEARAELFSDQQRARRRTKRCRATKLLLDPRQQRLGLHSASESASSARGLRHERVLLPH